MEKIETELSGMREREKHLNQQLDFVKEHYLLKKAFDEKKEKIMDHFNKLCRDNEDDCKKNARRMVEVEKDLHDDLEKMK
jgi:hypothetical protein